jgi:hypothetical protein
MWIYKGFKMLKLIFIFTFISNIVLYADVIPQNLSSTEVDARLNKVNGDSSEYVMNKLLKKNGWKQIHGEIGNNGIDGLFVKYDQYGNVKEIMVAESKFGSSQIGTNKYGTPDKNIKQMSKKALLHQIDNLIKNTPHDENPVKYKQIQKLIEHENYRARLFNLKAEGDSLIIDVKKIAQNGDIDILKKPLFGRENYKFNGLKIDINNPKTKFEENLVKQYNHARTIALEKHFAFSSLEAKTLIEQKGRLTQADIEKTIGIRKYIQNQIHREYRTNLRKLNNISAKQAAKLKKMIYLKWLRKYMKILKKSIK